MCNAHTMHHTTDLIGSAEACRILGDISRSTLTRWVDAGRITPAARASETPNGAFLFTRAEVERLLAERARHDGDVASA